MNIKKRLCGKDGERGEKTAKGSRFPRSSRIDVVSDSLLVNGTVSAGARPNFYYVIIKRREKKE